MTTYPGIEVCMSIAGETVPVGRLGLGPAKGAPRPRFEYYPDWLGDPRAFAIDPEAPLTRGQHYSGKAFFTAIGDSAPDKWGRSLMQKRERYRAKRDGDAVRTLFEHDYLLGVADEPRMGGIRFRLEGEECFQAPLGGGGVPALISLPALYEAADRVERGVETDEDVLLLFFQGSSLGGARPKASVKNKQGELCIAKFPKADDDYSIERWEGIALTLAEKAGMNVARHEVVKLQGRDVLLSVRFDREGEVRIPFMSAMARLQATDGEMGSYLELVDAISEYGLRPKSDRAELFRRVAFNILISNVDDHLRNHGFLYREGSWLLSPLYDVNPTPIEKKPRILTTAIDDAEATCSIGLLLETGAYYGLSDVDARRIVKGVAEAIADWREVAKKAGAPAKEIEMMASAFEHEDKVLALSL